MATRQDEQAHKVILVGVGGASCSGKTTVAKHLHGLIPNSVIVHQDDFAPPYESIPYHPIHKVQDWDRAQTAIDWPKLRAFVEDVKRTGEVPPEHKSADHLNADNNQQQSELAIGAETRARWAEVFRHLAADEAGGRVVWAFVDGFLLYWDPVVMEHLEAKILLRTPHDVLKERRGKRATYATTEAETRTDPPNYWENVVWPAYVEAHKDVFADGDVEHGESTDEKVPDLLLIEAEEHSMDDIVSTCCERLLDYVKGT